MAHTLHVIPDSSGSAAQNMAIDFLMLQHYKPAEAIRFRHYGWIQPAYTFGLSQQMSYALSETHNPNAEVVRRPTGGGVVDHSSDWTYSLVIPASHPLAKAPPVDTYRDVHQCIVDAMAAQDLLCELNDVSPDDTAPSVCFNKAELNDVVLKNLPSKLAGAAQKRTKNGYLLQGSIWKELASKVSWPRFYNDFLVQLSALMDAQIEYLAETSWQASEEEALTAQFESDAWNKRR